MMLAWLALALLTIGVKPQQDATSGAGAARTDHSAQSPRQKPRPVAAGSLARLVNDPRCSSGAALAFEINAAEDGLSPSVQVLAGLSRRKVSLSWLSPVWLAHARLRSAPSGGRRPRRDRAASQECLPLTSGARLGWSGCTAFYGDNEEIDRLLAAAQRREHAPASWFSAAFAGAVRNGSNRLTPWFDFLAAHANHASADWIRVSRRPERAGSLQPQERAIPESEFLPAGNLTL